MPRRQKRQDARSTGGGPPGFRWPYIRAQQKGRHPLLPPQGQPGGYRPKANGNDMLSPIGDLSARGATAWYTALIRVRSNAARKGTRNGKVFRCVSHKSTLDGGTIFRAFTYTGSEMGKKSGVCIIKHHGTDENGPASPIKGHDLRKNSLHLCRRRDRVFPTHPSHYSPRNRKKGHSSAKKLAA